MDVIQRFTIMENDILYSNKIETERKTFYIDLKSNARGQVIRITEKVKSNRDLIMVPAEIIDEFIAALEEVRNEIEKSE